MMIITFTGNLDWCKANWVFRQLAKDLVDRVPLSADAAEALDLARAFQRLDLPSLAPTIALELLDALIVTVESTSSGIIPGWTASHPEDRDGARMYANAIAELLISCRREANARR